MARRRTILIPPSEGKALGGEGPAWHRVPGAGGHPLYAQRRAVVEALGDLMGRNERRELAPGTLARLFGVRGDALQRAVDADSSLPEAPTLPAIERYDGVLYQHLELDTMSPSVADRLDRTVLIASGLWGVVAPHEMIPDYRLKMSANLEPMGRLSSWWRPELTHFVEQHAKGTELWNLLPGEHAAALGATSHRVVNTAVFLSPDRGGELKAVSHWNKALKGALVAHLVRNPSLRPHDLTEWEHPGGYRLEPASLEPRDGVRELRFVAPG